MTKQEKHDRNLEILGKFFYDLAKTCFAVLVAANLVNLFNKEYSDGEKLVLISVGIGGTVLFAIIGSKLLEK